MSVDSSEEKALRISPLGGTIGAEIRGVDLSRPLDPATTETLRKAWLRFALLVFRGQTLNDDALRRSADWLGAASEITMPTDRRGDDDIAIALVSNILDESGQPIGALGDGEMWFHHDNSFTPEPDIATWLYAVELPAQGGDTLFGDCAAAWDALPDPLRERVLGRRVLQVYDYTIREKPDLHRLDGVPHCWQPAVVQHPETGRRALYVDRLMSAALDSGGDGQPADDGPALLEELFPYVERTDYRHEWRLGDYVIWDNRSTVHARTDFPADERRLLKRGKIAGAAMVAA
jgi:taurine dioxygenase